VAGNDPLAPPSSSDDVTPGRRLPSFAKRSVLNAAVVLAAVALLLLAARALSRWRDREEESRLREVHSLAGNVRQQPFQSAALGATRRIWIYLPPRYHLEPERRFPVLYMLDGQNVFDGATAFIAGQEWEVDETAERLIAEGRIEPLIVVAVDNGGERRIEEYTPTRDASVGQGGGLDRTARLLRDELKPWVDARFRTRPERGATGIAGSSLGGLAALELALRHPDLFGRAAALSVSAWWDGRSITKTVQDLAHRPELRLWVDIGTGETGEALAHTRALRDALLRKGWQEGSDLRYLEVDGGTHDEAAWAKRMGDVLEFLYPPESPASNTSAGAAAAPPGGPAGR
jgi:predicted alpha/beta superfamily hydrolase